MFNQKQRLKTTFFRSSLFILLTFPFVFLTAQPGFGLDLDGTDDHINCGGDLTLNLVGANLSLEAWIYPTSWAATVDEGYIIAKEDVAGSGYILRAGNGGILQFTLGNGVLFTSATTGSGALSLNEWQHVAGVFDGSEMKIYINGELAQSLTAAITVAAAAANLILGSSATHVGVKHFPGSIDEIRLWSVVRSQEEILDNMYQSLTGAEANLNAYYKMSDGTGTSLTDNSANSNTGTLTNMDPGTDWITSEARIADSSPESFFYKRPGNGLSLEGTGSDDYIGITDPTNLQITGDLTLEGWAEMDNFSNVGTLVTCGIEGDLDETENDLYSFIINTNKTLSLNWEYGASGTDVSITSSTAANILANEWHHFSVVRSSTDMTVTFYVDGLQLGTVQGYVNNPTGGTASNVNIGADVTGVGVVSDELLGTIDDVRIWNDIRTQSEIRQNMNGGLQGTETNLQGYFPMNAHSGTVVEDKTSNSYDGTLTNMDAATDWVNANAREANKAWTDGNWSAASTWVSYNVPNSTGEWVDVNADITMDANYSLNHVLVKTGATLTLGAGSTLTNSGDLFNYGTVTGTGNISFAGSSAQVLYGSGTLAAGTITLNNASGLTLEQNVTINTSLVLTNGAFSLADNSLTLNGSLTSTSGSLLGGASSDIIIGGAGAQLSMPAVSLNNLTLNRSNGLSLAANVRVDGTLTLTDGLIDPNSNVLILGTAAVVAGVPSASNHVDGTSGTMRKEFAGTGSFNFPLGDGTIYSPISLNFSSGTFSSAFLDASVTTSKHPSNSSSSHYLSRYWTVTNTGISSFSAVVNAIYDDSDITGTESEIRSGKWNGSAWQDLGAVTTGTNTVTGTITSFSDFTGGEAVAFPVEWLDFSANAFSGKVQLDWSTATEINTSHFVVERSEDFQNWSEIGQVEAVGYSQAPTSYKYLDGFLPSDQLFYRLRQVDLDGQFSYSSTVQVSLGNDLQFSIYPNPVSSTLFLDLDPRYAKKLVIMDVQGREALKQAISGSDNFVDISRLTPGVYSIQIYFQNEIIGSTQFIKQ